MLKCPCCQSKNTAYFSKVDGFNYYSCQACDALYIDPAYLAKIDQGLNLVQYDSAYWESELESARERAYGSSLARMAEAFHYARIPIHRFLDVGTGSGYFLDAVAGLLPNSPVHFYGVERFPPPLEHRSSSPRYVHGEIKDLDAKFDGGICIEVIEHLTPTMLGKLLEDLASVSNPGALYIFNSGSPAFVIQDDPGYLDPTRRGHIVSYSLRSVETLCAGMGFKVLPIPGKTWAFALEYQSQSPSGEDIRDRIWSALDINLRALTDEKTGSVLRLLGLETSRAYGGQTPSPPSRSYVKRVISLFRKLYVYYTRKLIKDIHQAT